MTERETQEQRGRVSRRQFLKWMGTALGVGVGIGVGASALESHLREENYTGEGNEDVPLAGEILKGGEIVSDEELSYLYLQAIREKRPIEPDSTIIKSTVHNAMVFFGMDEGTAARRCENISISTGEDKRCERGDLACVYDSSLGLGLELTQRPFSREQNWGEPWVNLSLILSRSAYTMSVDMIDDRELREDYGVLGEYLITYDKRGFTAKETYRGGVGDLLRRTIILDSQTNETASMDQTEQFFSDLGQIRYFKRLLSLGLDRNENAVKYEDFAFYPFMGQGLVNIQDEEGIGGAESWQDWWGEALKFDRVDKLHRESDRFGLFSGIGERIVERNINQGSIELSTENTAALGVVALSDFIDYHLSSYRIVGSLEAELLSPASIIRHADWLYLQMNRETPPPLPLKQARINSKPTPTA